MKTKLSAKNSVLFIVDIQEKLANIMEDKTQVIKNNNILIEMARAFSMDIIFTEQYPKGLGFTSDEILINREKDFIEEKTSFTGLTPNVKEKLKALGKNTIILTGMETHICVYQTARDLISDGYRVVLVMDAVCSRTKDNKNNGLDLMKLEGAIISNTETVLYDLLEVSGTPIFKELSKLIK